MKNKSVSARPVNLPSKTIEERLKPSKALLTQGDLFFYLQLQHSIWNYVADNFHLTGSDLNRTALTKKLTEAGIAASMIRVLTEIQDLCEMYIYNEIDSLQEEGIMMEKTEYILTSIDDKLKIIGNKQ